MALNTVFFALWTALLLSSTCSANRALKEAEQKCGKVDQICRDAIPTQSWGVTPPLPTCCEAGTTCTFISRYSRCLKNYSACETAYGLMTNWEKWSGNKGTPFSTTLKIIKDAGLLGKLQTHTSKTFFAPTNEAWEKFKKTAGAGAYKKFSDKAYVQKWLDFVLIPNVVGNGGGQRVFNIGKIKVDMDMYQLVGPASAGFLSNIVSDWKCTVAGKRDYVYDTDTVFLPCTCGTSAPWEPPI